MSQPQDELTLLKAARDSLQELGPRLTQQQRRNLKRIEDFLSARRGGDECKMTA